MARPDQPVPYRSYLKPGQVLPPPVIPPAVVALADLTPARKRALWDWMQAHDPETATYLQGLKADPALAELEAAFGAVRPVVNLDYIRRAIG